MYRRGRIFLALLLLAGTVAACGNDGDQPDTAGPAPSPGAGVPIRGTERFAWDQAAPSYQRVLQYTFAVYVDGTKSALSGVDCIDSLSASGFTCSARLPQMSNGVHVLELAAVVDTVESTRSSPLTVNVSQGRLVASGVEVVERSPRARTASLCVAPAACFTVTREITAAVPLSSPAATPDGRLFFVEDGRRVRILVDGVLSAGPAFSLTDDDARLVALLVDPSFDRTRFVLLAWIEQTRRGRSLVIARVRESGNRLGEPAVIVPGIPISASGDPRFAQDDQGRIYVAIPGNGEAMHSGTDAYAASLLRFAANGLTWSEGLGPPIVALGYDQPRALTFDPRTSRLWLTGGDRGRGEGLTSIAIGHRGGAASDQSAALEPQIVILPSAETIVGLVPIGRNARADFVAVDSKGNLLIAQAGPDGLAAQGRASFESGELLSLAAGLSGEILATARSTAGSVASYSIFRLDPQIAR